MGVASKSSKPSTLFGTFQNLVKPFIGAGILALPASFYKGGVVASGILMFVLAIMANYCIRCLLDCVVVMNEQRMNREIDEPLLNSNDYRIVEPAYSASTIPSHLSPTSSSEEAQSSQPLLVANSTNSSTTPALSSEDTKAHNGVVANSGLHYVPSYREIGEVAFGFTGQFLVDFNLTLSQLGFCTAYMVFISSNMEDMLPQLHAFDYIMILFAAFTVLCQIRDISTVAFTSTLGNLIYAFAITMIFYDGFAHSCCISSSDTKDHLISLKGLPFMFGTACFALEGIGLVLPVKAAMKPEDSGHFYKLLNAAVILVAILYVVFSSLGFFFYGSKLESEDTITGLLTSGGISISVSAALCVSLFFSYIIQMFPVVLLTDELTIKAFKRWGSADHETSSLNKLLTESSSDDALLPSISGDPTVVNSGSTRNVFIAQCFARFLCVGFTALIAAVVTNFNFVVSLTGSLANSAIAFLLPQLFYLKIVVIPSTPILSRDSQLSVWQRLVYYRAYYLPVTVLIIGLAASILGVYFAFASEV